VRLIDSRFRAAENGTARQGRISQGVVSFPGNTAHARSSLGRLAGAIHPHIAQPQPHHKQSFQMQTSQPSLIAVGKTLVINKLGIDSVVRR